MDNKKIVERLIKIAKEISAADNELNRLWNELRKRAYNKDINGFLFYMPQFYDRISYAGYNTQDQDMLQKAAEETTTTANRIELEWKNIDKLIKKLDRLM